MSLTAKEKLLSYRLEVSKQLDDKGRKPNELGDLARLLKNIDIKLDALECEK